MTYETLLDSLLHQLEGLVRLILLLERFGLLFQQLDELLFQGQLLGLDELDFISLL